MRGRSWPRTLAAACCALCLSLALFVTLHLSVASTVASADSVGPVINEFVANHEGFTPDDDHEYIEVRGAPNTSYADLTILEINGDFEIMRGRIDGVFPVTTTNAGGYWWTGFLPTNSLKNTTMTLLMVSGFSGAAGQDLDTDDDGNLDSLPWADLLDAIAVSDGGVNDRTYAAVTLPFGFDGRDSAAGGASRIPDGGDTDTTTDWAPNDYEGAGLPGFTGALSAGEALHTPGSRNLKPVRLAVVRTGPGAGSVVSAPAAINCGAICAASFSAYDPVTLTAAAQPGSTFAGWSQPCAGNALCSVVLTQPMTLTVLFTRTVYALTTGKIGSGGISSDPAGIVCGNDCAHHYTHGASVELIATPQIGWSFDGWSGACTGVNACIVTMDRTKAVTATFTLNHYDLVIHRSGSGTVSSEPAGIACGDTCLASYGHGTLVELSAVADPGWSFSGWSGACNSTDACNVTMDAAKTVTATFMLNSYTLSVHREGGGTVTSDPAGIVCGADCTQSYAHASIVNLAAAAEPGWSFSGWSGACNGSAACSVIMDVARTVTASFTLNTYALTVERSGSGMVSSDPAGIECGANCAHTYEHGALVDLTASADSGWAFSGWDGACSGSGACHVTLDGDKTVAATFTLNHYALTVAKLGTGSGTVTEDRGALNCGPVCSVQLAHGAEIELTAVAGAGSSFTGWGGACTDVGTCALTMSASTVVSATFTLDPVDEGSEVYLPAIQR